MFKKRHYKKIIKLFAINAALILPASSIAVVSQMAVSNSASNVGAILSQQFENEDLIDQLHFCSSTYISNEDQIDPTKLTIGYDTVNFKIVTLEWRNASATIPTVDANFKNIIDWFNANKPTTGGAKWTFSNETVLKSFFDQATNNRARWSGKLTWPGLNIPAGTFNSYYLSDKLFNWDSIVIQDGCLSIGNDAFQGVSTLKDAWFPTTLTQIGSLAFAWTGLQICNLIGGQLYTIGDYAFYQCDQLADIVIKTNSSLNLSIGDDCFRYDGTLTTKEAQPRSVVLYAENIGELKKSCFAYKNILSSGTQSLESFTFGYLKDLNTINKASISPWLDTTADNIYVPVIYDNEDGVLNAWDSFFPQVSTIIPPNGISLNFLNGYNDEIHFNYVSGYDGTLPIIAAHSLAEGYAEPLDIDNTVIGLYTCSDMNPAKPITDETQITGVTFDKSVLPDDSIGFKIHIQPYTPYFAPTSGTTVSKAAWIVIKYNSQYIRYRLCYFYNETAQRATAAANVQVFLNGTPASGNIPVNMDNAVDGRSFNINTGWTTGTDNAPTISSNDVLTIDTSISTYPNIQYDQIQKRIDFQQFCLPGSYTFAFSVTTQSQTALTVTKNFSLTFVVTRTPTDITIHNNSAKFLSGVLPAGGFDEMPDIYYLTTTPARCDEDADWEIIQNGANPLPPGLYIKQNSEQTIPAEFPGSTEEWNDVSAGQLWTNHNSVPTSGEYTFKVKASINNTGIINITDQPQTIYFVNSNIHEQGIIKINKTPYGDDTGNGQAIVSQNVETYLNVGFDFAPGFDFDLLRPYARLYDRYGQFPQGVEIIRDENDPLFPYKIRANVTSQAGDYWITIGGRSDNFYLISVQEYTIVLHVLPAPVASIPFPKTLIILFIVIGIFITAVTYTLIRKFIRKH